MGDRDVEIFRAKICEQTERFDDMVKHMTNITKFDQELSLEERNLLSVAFKNSLGPKRTAWRAMSGIEQKEEAKGSQYLDVLRAMKTGIEEELTAIIDAAFDLITGQVEACTTTEAKVFYQKMQGDYCRYKSEYAQAEAKGDANEKAKLAYEAAFETAHDLAPTHPITLGLALNRSVFYYEIMNEPEKACQVAKEAFDAGVADIEELDDDHYKDATTIMQLIRDNLTLWTSEMQQEEIMAEGDA